jgi:hypothetical protein
MIELEVNGSHGALAPASVGELRSAIRDRCPTGHVICELRINGRDFAESRLDEVDLKTLRSVEVRSATPRDLAHSAVEGTIDWIGRISAALDEAAHRFRMGQEKEGAQRLAAVSDALSVLMELLGGIRAFADVDPAQRAWVDERWPAAERELRGAIEGLVQDLQAGDPVQLADRSGYLLPSSLARFRELLERMRA